MGKWQSWDLGPCLEPLCIIISNGRVDIKVDVQEKWP